MCVARPAFFFLVLRSSSLCPPSSYLSKEGRSLSRNRKQNKNLFVLTDVLVLQKLLTNVRSLPFLREHNFENSEIFAKKEKKPSLFQKLFLFGRYNISL